MKTLIAVPCMDTMPTGFVQSLLYLDKGSDVAVCFKANSLVYDSRNLLSLSAIEENFDRVMWFDSDMMFTKDTMKILMDDMDRLMHAEEQYPTGKNGCHMVTGLYFKRRSPFTPVLYSELDEPGIDENGKPVPHVTDYVDYPHDTVFPVKGCGFGCVLMTTNLLRDVWKNYGPAFSPYPWASEDISFCHRVNQLGYTIYCDSRVSCGHIGTFVYTEDNVPGKKVEK